MGDSNDVFDSIITKDTNADRIKEYIQKYNNTIHGDVKELYSIGEDIGYIHINLEDIEDFLSKGFDVYITTTITEGRENCMKKATENAISKLGIDPKHTMYAILVVWKGSSTEFTVKEQNNLYCFYKLFKENFCWGIYPHETLGDKIKVTLMVIA